LPPPPPKSEWVRRTSSASRARPSPKATPTKSRGDGSPGGSNGSNNNASIPGEGGRNTFCRLHRRMCRHCSACNPFGVDLSQQVSASPPGGSTPRLSLPQSAASSQKSLTSRKEGGSSSMPRGASSSPMRRTSSTRPIQDLASRPMLRSNSQGERAQRRGSEMGQTSSHPLQSPARRRPGAAELSSQQSPEARKAPPSLTPSQVLTSVRERRAPSQDGSRQPLLAGINQNLDSIAWSRSDDTENLEGLLRSRASQDTDEVSSPTALTELALEKSRRLLELLSAVEDGTGSIDASHRTLLSTVSGGVSGGCSTAGDSEPQMAQMPADLIRMISDLWEEVCAKKSLNSSVAAPAAEASATDQEAPAAAPTDAPRPAVERQTSVGKQVTTPMTKPYVAASKEEEVDSEESSSRRALSSSPPPCARVLQYKSPAIPRKAASRFSSRTTASTASSCSLSSGEPGGNRAEHFRGSTGRERSHQRASVVRGSDLPPTSKTCILTDRPSKAPTRHASPAVPRVFQSWAPMPTSPTASTPVSPPVPSLAASPIGLSSIASPPAAASPPPPQSAVGGAAPSPTRVAVQSPALPLQEGLKTSYGFPAESPAASVVAPGGVSSAVSVPRTGRPPQLYEVRTVAVTTVHHFLHMC